MDFNQLKNFMAVARTGNISRAAQELYVTQPSLSKSIAKLEEELKVPLFRHRKGHIELNEYGSVFLSSVDIAFSHLMAGAQTIQRMYEMDQHILSLGSNISAYLPEVLPEFCAEHPEIGIRQRDCSTQQMINAILDRSMTLGISCETIKHDQIRFRQLGHKEYVLMVHKSNPIANSEWVKIPDLEQEIFIVDSSRLRLGPLQKLCQEYGFQPKVGFEVESTGLLYNLVENNRGIAIVPLGLGCDQMRLHPDHNMRLVRIDKNLPHIIIGVASHKNYEYSEAAKLFEEHLIRRLAQEDQMIRDMGYDFD